MKCKDCGACCKWLIVNGKPHPAELELWTMRECRFLEGKIAIPARCKYYDDEKKCTIYDKRPSICRRFERGSSGCKECRDIEEL